MYLKSQSYSIRPAVLKWGQSAFPGTKMSRDIFGYKNYKIIKMSRDIFCYYTMDCTGQTPTAKNYLAKNVKNTEVEKPALDL